MNKQAVELTKKFVQLLLINHSHKIPDKDAIYAVFKKLLTFYPFQRLWDAVYVSQEDPFWVKVITDIRAFDKHIEKLDLKGQDYPAPIPVDPEGYTAAQLTEKRKLTPRKSLLQLHKEKLCQQRKQT